MINKKEYNLPLYIKKEKYFIKLTIYNLFEDYYFKIKNKKDIIIIQNIKNKNI